MARAAQPQMSPEQANLFARNLVIARAVEMKQLIYSNTFVPANNPVINVVPRNVGLIKGFIVEVTATVLNAAGNAINLTDYNILNTLTQIVFTDLNNNQRINTTGMMLGLLSTERKHRVYGSSVASDSPVKYGSNFTVISAPATIGAGMSGTVNMIYYVPLAYSDDDLRGAVYANVVNATMQLQLTPNPSPATLNSNPTTLLYTGNPATFSTMTLNVYQVYLDQLPMGEAGVILPMMDLATIYELKNTALTGMTVNQDFPIPFPNFRNFLGQTIVYDNQGTLAAGTDINTIALQSANFTNIWRLTPRELALEIRNTITTDMPKGGYYLNFRRKPISTIQYGNMETVINPSNVAGAASQFLVGFEAFALINTITGAGSLPGG